MEALRDDDESNESHEYPREDALGQSMQKKDTDLCSHERPSNEDQHRDEGNIPAHRIGHRPRRSSGDDRNQRGRRRPLLVHPEDQRQCRDDEDSAPYAE